MRIQSLLVLTTVTLLLLGQVARADLLYYDTFNYPSQIPGTAAHTSSGNTLGVNWPSTDGKPAGSAISPWIIYLNGNSSPYVGSGSLSYSGLSVDPSGNSATYRGDAGSGNNYHWFGQPTTWDGTNTAGSGQPPFTTYAAHPATSTTLYYSLLLNVSQVGSSSGVTVQTTSGPATLTSDGWNYNATGNFPNGQFLTAFMSTASYSNQTSQANTAGALMIMPVEADPNNPDQYATTYQLGIGSAKANPNSGGAWFASNVFGLNQTIFAVVAYTMNPATGTNVAKLYINPTPGSLESSNAVAAQTPLGAAELEAALTGFVLKDDQHLPDYGLSIDELRIGTTWADVTPAAAPSPEPATLSLLALPALLALSRRRRA